MHSAMHEISLDNQMSTTLVEKRCKDSYHGVQALDLTWRTLGTNRGLTTFDGEEIVVASKQCRGGVT